MRLGGDIEWSLAALEARNFVWEDGMVMRISVQ